MIDHALRRRCINSTDVGPIFGVDDFRDSHGVWSEKHGYAPPFEPTKRMLLGKDLEQGILKAWSRITGKPYQWVDETRQNKMRPWMAASPDALVGTPLERVVDAKLVFYDQRRKWGPDSNSIPEAYQLQVWWQMAVCGCDVADIAALVGEDEPRIYTIERNQEAERVVIDRCEEWYRRYVVGTEIPPITGSKASGIWLQQAFPNHKRPDMREATPEEATLLEEYTEVRIVRQSATSLCDQIENQIKLAIGDREGLEWPGGTFTWRRTKDGVEIDWESLGKGLLNEKDPEMRNTLLGIHTKPKPGQRRMRFVSHVADVADV